LKERAKSSWEFTKSSSSSSGVGGSRISDEFAHSSRRVMKLKRW